MLTITAVTAVIVLSVGMIEYRRVGGIHFWRVGRLGGSFYLSKIPSKNS